MIILDLNMPGLDGLGTLREIRRLGIRQPVLLATGHLDSAALAVLDADPLALAIAKPFTKGELGGKIGELMARVPA